MKTSPPARHLAGRAAGLLLTLATGLLIFVVLGHPNPRLPGDIDPYARVIVTVALLAAALLCRQVTALRPYWPLAFAFFIASLVTALDLYTSYWIYDTFSFDANTPLGFAVMRTKNAVFIIGLIVLLNRLAGGSLGSIYIQKGRLKQGLLIGLGTFLGGAAIAIPMAVFLYKGTDINPQRILSWLPYLLVFVLVNAAYEELLFRGIFLRKLEPFFGRFLANLLTAIVFAFSHSAVTYSSDILLFLSGALVSALAWGWLMQKTDSLWGSILFHAGLDIPIMLGIFSTLA